jgi:hypothetical protein
MWTGWESVTGSCEQGNEQLRYLKNREILDKLGDNQLFSEDSPSWRMGSVYTNGRNFNLSFFLK